MSRLSSKHFGLLLSKKVAKISNHLQNYPNFVPPSRDVPQLRSYDPESCKNIMKIMTKLENKQSELDKFPVHILNNNKECIVQKITKVVNNSLTSGQFPDHRSKQ